MSAALTRRASVPTVFTRARVASAAAAGSFPLAESFARVSAIAFFAGVGRAQARVEQLHRMTGLRRDLRDAGAHRARADDGDGAPGSERGGHRGTRHRPVKCGGRLSMNAATPSR